MWNNNKGLELNVNCWPKSIVFFTTLQAVLFEFIFYN